MNLDIAKKWVNDHLMEKHCFKYIGSRNQEDVFLGFISKMYPNVFLIETDINTYKCFSYNDIVIGSIRIVS